MQRHRLIIVASHVIQYQDPFFKLLAADPEIDLTVLYCSPQGAVTYHDSEMATMLRWDLHLLEGYRHRFLKNLSRRPGGGYGRLINPGIIPSLLCNRPDAVIFMMGWGAITALAGMMTCRIARIPFFLYGDSSFPPLATTWRSRLRAGALRGLFSLTTGFMVSGVLNADFYEHYGAERRRFFLLPWAVDNDRFFAGCKLSPSEKNELRVQHDIPPDHVAFLFSAKLIDRKDPMTLLRAYEGMHRRDAATLVFMGDGALRKSLERYVSERGLSNVRFLGFVNQTDLPRHYAMCDVFVLPSIYEPRGAVINEAMACGLPLIVTDRCGSIGDIVQEGENAWVYPAGDALALSELLDRMTERGDVRCEMADASRRIIESWDYRRGVDGVRQAMAWVSSGDRM